ncbi:hypothetical protein C0Q70_17416 [Pomacea canaliculata]|uniref:Uncharacterized protein n=2 Tax=Pomacea canaliculata TaxID=400727 RepID=A0A2T7NKC1_POMCA|nr:hypothetical protein C0Q70_17416 [Pomacea canaliculata]
MAEACPARLPQVSGSLPVEWLLVSLLYMLLATEIINILRDRYMIQGHRSDLKDPTPASRPLVTSTRKPCGMSHKKKAAGSLDHLWRRMRQATNQMRLINLRHQVITKVMMESRIEARMQEREKQQRKKQKLLAELK